MFEVISTVVFDLIAGVCNRPGPGGEHPLMVETAI